MTSLEDRILKIIEDAESVGVTARQIAIRLGKKREHISHYLWILKKTGKVTNINRNLWILQKHSKQEEEN